MRRTIRRHIRFASLACTEALAFGEGGAAGVGWEVGDVGAAGQARGAGRAAVDFGAGDGVDECCGVRRGAVREDAPFLAVGESGWRVV